MFHENKGKAKNWNAVPETLAAIKRFVRADSQCLETGAGASTVFFAAKAASHVVISPSEAEHRRIRHYAEGLGIEASNVKFVPEMSDRVLPAMWQDGSLDFVFVDGAHSFPFPSVDWHFTQGRLAVGGFMFLDDVIIPSVATVFHAMARDPSHCVRDTSQPAETEAPWIGASGAGSARDPRYTTGVPRCVHGC